MSSARKQPASLRPDATRFALAAVPVKSTIHRPFTPVNAGCTPGSSGNANAASLGRRVGWGANPNAGRLGGCWGSLRSPQPTRRNEPSRRPSAAVFGIPREHGVQPRVKRANGAMNGAGDKDSSESAAGRVWAAATWLLHAALRPCSAGVRFRASSLVTFFWPRRRKLPGRRDGLPAMQRSAALLAKASQLAITLNLQSRRAPRP